MAYQFVHIETYSRKPNKHGVGTQFIFDEASRRTPAACKHIEHPAPPELVFGMGLDDLEREHDARAAAATMTNQKGQVRSIRKDQKTLACIVLSHPGDCDGIAPVSEWQRRSVRWLQKRYGDRLKTVVRHDDESHPHLHAYLLPEGSQMLARTLHAGEAAKAEFMSGKAGKDANRAGDQAYRKAMREWQDDYFRSVGVPCGLARIGPGQRRLSRSAWQAEQQAVQQVRHVATRAKSLRNRYKDEAARRFSGSGWINKIAVAVKVREKDAEKAGFVRGSAKTKAVAMTKISAKNQEIDTLKSSVDSLKTDVLELENKIEIKNSVIEKMKEEISIIKRENKVEIEHNDAIYNLLEDVIKDGYSNGYNSSAVLDRSLTTSSSKVRNFINTVVTKLKKFTSKTLRHTPGTDPTIKRDAS
uniref:Mobilization protein n=1 Tax=Komagataeibacter europaeus TaxID=33995 RepID=A0A089ZW58_KOMEU|nr:mobilization protein [Komagataeibacter europaeus]